MKFQGYDLVNSSFSPITIEWEGRYNEINKSQSGYPEKLI
jgi:hypothetical protein